MGVIATGLKEVRDALKEWEDQVAELNRKLKVACNSVGYEFTNAREVFGMLEVYLIGAFKEKGTTWLEEIGSKSTLADHLDKRIETLIKQLNKAREAADEHIEEIRKTVKTQSAKMTTLLNDAQRVATNLKKRTKTKKKLSFLKTDKRKKTLDEYIEALDKILDKTIPTLRDNVDALADHVSTCDKLLQPSVDSLVIETSWTMAKLNAKTSQYSKDELAKYVDKIAGGAEGASNFRELNLDKEYKAIKELLDDAEDLEEVLDE